MFDGVTLKNLNIYLNFILTGIKKEHIHLIRQFFLIYRLETSS
jgi:hypothetical protein